MPPQLAATTGPSLYNLLNGDTWGDFAIIVRLEIHFNRRLWGNEHRKKPCTARRVPEPQPPCIASIECSRMGHNVCGMTDL